MEEKDFVTAIEDTNVTDLESTVSSGLDLKKVLAGGAIILGGVLLYKKVIKPALANRKAKKEQLKTIETECKILEDDKTDSE